MNTSFVKKTVIKFGHQDWLTNTVIFLVPLPFYRGYGTGRRSREIYRALSCSAAFEPLGSFLGMTVDRWFSEPR